MARLARFECANYILEEFAVDQKYYFLMAISDKKGYLISSFNLSFRTQSQVHCLPDKR